MSRLPNNKPLTLTGDTHILTRDAFVGPWAGLPIAWDANDAFDEAAHRANVRRCCEAGIPGVYTGGTTGEFYALELDEFKAVARATVEECHAHDVPAMVGCTSTHTRGASLRAAFAAEIGADAVQLALPFWLEVGDKQLVPFFKDVSDASGGLPLSIYETTRAKKTLTVEQHQAIHEAVPNYLMVKANANTIGAMPDGCQALAAFVNVFTHETAWARLGPLGVSGCCSAMVYWNPRIVLAMWAHLQNEDWDALDQSVTPVIALHEFLLETYAPKGFTDTAYDRMGAQATGFLEIGLDNRKPYPSPTPQDVIEWRDWCTTHYPEMLEL